MYWTYPIKEIYNFAASFVGLILNLDKLLEYSILLIVIGVITFIFYSWVDFNFREISERIRDLVNPREKSPIFRHQKIFVFYCGLKAAVCLRFLDTKVSLQ